MTYDEWEQTVPPQIKGDTLWRVKAYRLSLFLADLVWADVKAFERSVRTKEVAEQIPRSVWRISACIGEGYSRDTGKARSTYYEYAAGSTRETRDWYHKGRRVIRGEVLQHRLDLCTEVLRLTLTMIANERRTNRRASGTQ
jgi:four helix bundle protein